MDHITDLNTRRVLLGELTDTEPFLQALDHAEDCLMADYGEENVSFELYNQREAHLVASDHAFKLGEYDVAVRQLRNFWFT